MNECAHAEDELHDSFAFHHKETSSMACSNRGLTIYSIKDQRNRASEQKGAGGFHSYSGTLNGTQVYPHDLV